MLFCMYCMNGCPKETKIAKQVILLFQVEQKNAYYELLYLSDYKAVVLDNASRIQYHSCKEFIFVIPKPVLTPHTILIILC